MPEIDRQQGAGRRVAFRADAAFARPAIYEALEQRDVDYAIRMPANKTWELAVEDILFRPPGRPSCKPLVRYKSFRYQAKSWPPARRIVAKVEHHRGELFPRVGFRNCHLVLVKISDLSFDSSHPALSLHCVSLGSYDVGKYPQPLPLKKSRRKGILETLIILAHVTRENVSHAAYRLSVKTTWYLASLNVEVVARVAKEGEEHWQPHKY